MAQQFPFVYTENNKICNRVRAFLWLCIAMQYFSGTRMHNLSKEKKAKAFGNSGNGFLIKKIF